MNKKIYFSAVCALAINLSAADLGTIQVESSTIDDKLDTKTEVSSVAVISGEEVEEINPKTLGDILVGVPGVTLSNVGTAEVKIHIRGIDNQNYMGEKPGVAVVIDGVPVQETAGRINVDLDNIESIKVIKGGASYLYGNDALAGAIVITTKKPKGKSASKIEGELGSFNSKRVLATTNQSLGNSALQLQASYRDTDGYWDDAYSTIKSANGKYTYYIDETSDVTVGLDYTNRKTGDGNSVSGTIEAEENPKSAGEYSYTGYYDSDLIKAFASYSKDFGEESNLMLQLHKYRDDKSYKSARLKYDANEVWNQDGAKGEYRTVFGPLALMGGVDLQRNTTDELRYLAADGTLTSDYETKEAINAVYTELIYQLTESLTTTFNFRYDYIGQEYIDNTDSTNNVSPTYKVPSYRAGLNYALSGNNALYANFSTGFRTPTAYQMSVNNVALAADPALDIPSEIGVETTYNYELGARGSVSTLAYNASVYQLDRKDYIGRIAGNYITSDDENESNYDNVGDMRSRGFELSMNSDRSRMFSFDLAYTYLDAVFTRYVLSQQVTEDPDGPYRPLTAEYTRKDLSGNRVPRTSKHMIDFTLHYKPTEAALISAEVYAKSSYYADEVNEHEMPGYAVMNLRGEYRFNEMFEIFGRIDNLLNKNYYQFVNINSSALAEMETDATIRVAPPRAYYAGLRIRF
ncbi:TonB-dependent receptor [Sulfurimonas sp. HSL3-7]|uniref:TonB-dependent receptor n=1 Tax=Sulfonitrofixus jiaomeiensis TaxID=3131938 RepID=UPI0031FA11D1